MSDKPFCKLCRHSHGFGENHIWPDEPVHKPMAKTVGDMAKDMANMAKTAVAKTDVMANRPMAKKQAVTDSSTYRYRDPEKRRAYQRELMRQRYAIQHKD